MSFRIIPANIISRIQALGIGQAPDTATEGESDATPGTPHAGKHNEDGHYDPSPIDVVVVRIMLAKATKLPVDVIDGIFELAEYWVHTVTAADYTGHELTVRSLPIGFTSEHGGDLDLKGEPAPAKPLHNQTPAKKLERMADYPLPKLQGPVRKVVFKFTSHDQGWSGEAGGLYENSWTWFEAGLERLESSATGEPHDPPPTALHREALRPVYPTIVEVVPEEENEDDAHAKQNEQEEDGDNSQAKQEEAQNENEQNKSEDQETNPGEPQFEYKFPLLHSPKWTVCRNKRAHRDWQEHSITWACYDDVKPDSDGGKTLEENGRGRETGDGEYVRSLQLGDVVTLWAKSRFPGWTNNVKAASIDVYWAAT